MTTSPAPVADWVTVADLDRDPFAVYARLRAETPVAWVPAVGRYFITRYEDCRFVEVNPEIFTAEEDGHRVNRAIGVSMLRKDDPSHAVERRAVNPSLRIKAVQQIWKLVFQHNAEKILARLLDKGPGANLNDDFAAPFAAANLASLVGFPEVYWNDIGRWSAGFMAGAPNTAEDPDLWLRCRQANIEVDALLDDLIPRLRRTPDGSITAAMIGAGLPEAVVRADVKLAISGGINEPMHMITSGVWALSRHPEQLADVLDDPDLFSAAFAEVARWLSPVGMITRRVTRAVELDGVHLDEGALVGAAIHSANRDSTRFPDADLFDIRRDNTGHLAFGAGTHMCAGRWAAECSVGQVAWPLLYERLPGLRPLDEGQGRFAGWTFRGLETLPVTWGTATRRTAPTADGVGADIERLNLEVTKRERIAENVIALTLADPTGGTLPAWEAGAHLTLRLATGLERQYSLCGVPASNPDEYRIAVLREPAGRGGSNHIHGEAHEGDRLRVSKPRNNFAMTDGSRYQFVAAGIGITPILPMIAAAERAGAEWSLLYLGRDRRRMAFLPELEKYGERVTVWAKEERGRVNLSDVLSAPEGDTRVFACGPTGLLDDLEQLAVHWPKGALRVERFSARGPCDLPSNPFQVTVARTGQTFEVPADESIINVLERAGISVPSSCMEGTCGTCETTVLAGVPCHRDSLLTSEEREAGTRMLICVSRAKTAGLTLDR